MNSFIRGLLKRGWILTILLLVFGGIDGKQLKSTAGQVALQEVQQAQEKRDDINVQPIEAIIESKASDRFTQTEAHLFLPKIRDLIEKEYEVEKYLNIISAVIANEATFKDTHYAFYNTTPNMWRLAQDLYTRLYAYEHPLSVKAGGFKFLRFDIEAVEITAQDFLLKELKEKGLVDDNTATGAIMLSVNLSLFGNVGFPGECSWQYFVKPQGHKTPSRELYANMMDQFGLTHKYIDEIMSLFKIYDTEEDTIIQVLVPKEKVDEIGYLAWVKGIPAHSETINWILKNSKTKFFKHTKPTIEKLAAQFAKNQDHPLFKSMIKDVQSGEFSLDNFLKIYRNTPWKIDEINDVTARLLFTKDVLLNPESGVKLYRFSMVSRERLREYNTKLNAIVEKLIAEKESGAAKITPITQKPIPVK